MLRVEVVQRSRQRTSWIVPAALLGVSVRALGVASLAGGVLSAERWTSRRLRSRLRFGRVAEDRNAPFAGRDEAVLDETRRLRRERRYEEALDAMYRGLQGDPGSPVFRFHLAQAQEDLGLRLDALITYRSIVSFAGTLDSSAHRDSAQLILSARFRWAFVLGLGDLLAEQWLPPPPSAIPTRRSDELREIRHRLRPVLSEAFAKTRVAPPDLERLGLKDELLDGFSRLLDERPHLELHRDPLGSELSRREATNSRRLRARRLHLLFQLLAESAAERLIHDWSGGSATDQSRTAVHLLRARARMRTNHACVLLDHETSRLDESTGRQSPVALLNADPVEWPPTPELVRRLWSAQGQGNLERQLETSRLLEDHLMAARVYAIPLLSPRGQGPGAASDAVVALAAAAVDELERATIAVNLGAEIDRWDAISSQDADLAGLWSEPAFQRFESEAFPSAASAPVRPSSIARLEASRHSRRLVDQSAALMELIWRDRAARLGSTDVAEALAWLQDETAAWTMLRELALHHRHWQTRLRAAHWMQRLAESSDIQPLSLSRPRYSEAPIPGDAAAVERAARREVHFTDRNIRAVAQAVEAPIPPGLSERDRYLRDLDTEGSRLSADARRRLARDQASIWGSIRDMVAAGGIPHVGTPASIGQSGLAASAPLGAATRIDPYATAADQPGTTPAEGGAWGAGAPQDPLLLDRRLAVVLGVILTLVFVASLAASWLSGAPQEIPGVALGSPMLLRLEHAALATAVVGTVGLVLLRGFAGHWPLEIGTSGLKYASAVQELTELEQDVRLLREVAEEHERRLDEAGP